MTGRRSLAVLSLMVVLTVAPSLALAAAACAPHCCPAEARSDAGGSDDCRSGFANRVCCDETRAPLVSFAPAAHETPGFQAVLASPLPTAIASLRLPQRGAEAERALRTSPLRLSVVLLI